MPRRSWLRPSARSTPSPRSGHEARAFFALLLFAACECSDARSSSASLTNTQAKAQPEKSESKSAAANVRVFRGMCDASGAVPLGGSLFVVADDEDNVLRVYDSERGGDPLHAVDVSPALDLPAKKKPPEADIEAATKLGGRALWITSHGRNSKGKLQEARFRYFATTTPHDGIGIAPVGDAYEGLLDDLLGEPALAAPELAAASQLAPKEVGGLNLEGLTERADGKSVWLGFRNPRPAGKALLVPLLNPLALLEGARAQLGEPLLLDLQGLGVRALSYWRGHYLIMAGAVSNETPSKLFVWNDDGRAPRDTGVDLRGLNPEGFVSYDDKQEIMLLSDDGAIEIDGVACKKQKDPKRKSFRGVWIQVPGAQ